MQVRTIGRRKRTYLDEKCAGAITPKNPTLAVRVESDINQVQEDRGGLGEKALILSSFPATREARATATTFAPASPIIVE